MYFDPSKCGSLVKKSRIRVASFIPKISDQQASQMRPALWYKGQFIEGIDDMRMLYSSRQQGRHEILIPEGPLLVLLRV
jgi:hypothetical protein